MSQRDLINVKDLENDVLKLGDRLKPLQTSYTQSASGKGDGDEENGDGDPKEKPAETDIDEGGRPKLKEDKKSDKTIENEKSLDKTGGGS